MPIRTLLAASILLVACSFLPATLSAVDHTVLTTVTPQQVQAYLGELGFTGSSIDKDGDIFVNMQGHRVLLLIGSYEGRCVSPRFAMAGTKATMETVNTWNKDMRFSRAFLDSDGDPVLEADLDMDGGVTVDRVKDFLRTYSMSLTRFLQAIN